MYTRIPSPPNTAPILAATEEFPALDSRSSLAIHFTHSSV